MKNMFGLPLPLPLLTPINLTCLAKESIGQFLNDKNTSHES